MPSTACCSCTSSASPMNTVDADKQRLRSAARCTAVLKSGRCADILPRSRLDSRHNTLSVRAMAEKVRGRSRKKSKSPKTPPSMYRWRRSPSSVNSSTSPCCTKNKVSALDPLVNRMLSAATVSWVKNSCNPSRSSCTNPVVFKYCARTATIPPSPTLLSVPTPDADVRRPPCSRSRASSQCSKPRSRLSTRKAPPSTGAPAACIMPCLVNTSRMCGGTPVSTNRTLFCINTCPRGRKQDPAAVASNPVTLLKSSTRKPVVSRARLGVPSR
mmetsp:Transcript_30744/g.67424  ORF Transcript_30744/g.67424 Transcript_30744/m.67424 type:complete len:271 (-) Transcript_30744:545-1357(-)